MRKMAVLCRVTPGLSLTCTVKIWIWKDGWKAVARHQPGSDYKDDAWELFHAAEDFSEVDNLAQEYPARLTRLVDLWREEAERYDVLPLEDDTLKLYQQSVPAPRATFVFYPGMTRLDRLSAPDIYSYDSELVAEMNLDDGRSNGVILAAGDSSCGYEWFLNDGFIEFVYVYTRNEVFRFRSSQRISQGQHTARLRIRKTAESAARLIFDVDGEPFGELELVRMWPIYAANAGIRCGENRHAPVSREYERPFVFEHALTRVVVDVDLPTGG